MSQKIFVIFLFIIVFICPLSFAETNIIPPPAEDINESASKGVINQIKKITANQEKKSTVSAEEKEESTKSKHEAESYFTFLPSSGAKSANGSISLVESGFNYSYEFKAFGQLPITLSLGSEYIGIDNSNASLDLPSHLTSFTTGLEFILPFFNIDKTYISSGIEPSFFTDDWNFDSSSFRIPFNSFLIHKPNDKLTIIGGIAVFPDFKEKIYPVFGFIYKPNKQWIFNITSESPSIVYSPNKKWSFFGEIRTPLGSEFEVTRQDRSHVVLMYNDTRIGGGVTYNFNKFISTTLSMGGAFGRYFKYRDEDGKVSLDNGLYGKFAIDVQM